MRQHCCGPAVHSRRQHPHCSEQLLPVTKRACRVCPQRVSGSREASHPAAGNAQGAAPLAYTTRIASSPAELRAAAYLRAQSFYVYPSDRSEWAARSHRRMKADAEWESLTAKVEGREELYKGVEVVAFVATVDDVPEQVQAQQVADQVDPSTKLPADPDSGLPHPQVVVGTLDINIGRSLPAEELQGKLPTTDSSLQQGRAYLSNVCVAPAARRQGVAQSLVATVEWYLKGRSTLLWSPFNMGKPVSHLYVHVVHNNQPAIRLYKEGLGFEVESEETENFAQAASRPRRLLLCKQLTAH